MKYSRYIRQLRLGTVCCLIFSFSALAFGQSAPTRIVLGFSPGGPLDAAARIIAPELSKQLGSPVIIENKPGANAVISAETVARAPADGKTLWITSSGAVTINPTLYPNMPYDPLRDFKPVSLVGNTVEILVVGPSHHANNAEEFVKQDKSTNSNVTLGSSGTGSVPHLAAELLSAVTGLNLTHVPYKGVAPAITDSLAGHIDGLFADVPVVLELIRSGQLKALGVAADKRHPLLPNVKTFQEQGISGVESNNWYAVFAPAKTPPEVITRLNKAIQATVSTPAIKDRLAATGLQTATSTPEELAALVTEDAKKWGKVIHDKNIKVE